MAQISYTNKVALNENPEIANINKITDDDMNEIKQVVNDNYNNTIQITDTEPSDNDNKLWIDTGEISASASEITNEYSTSTGKGYSANYINTINTYSTSEVDTGQTWIDGKTIYRKILDLGNLPNATDKFVTHGINNLDIIIKMYGVASSSNSSLPLPFASAEGLTSNIQITRSSSRPGSIRIVTGVDRSSLTGYLILEYTKTS